MPEIEIIPATSAHRDDIMAVLETANMHHIPSKEMPELDLTHAWVALKDGQVVGFTGLTMLDDTRAKTTLLAVLPEYRQHGFGRMLQEKRMRAAIYLGAETLITNADNPKVIAWYTKFFGYRELKTIPKEHEFGLADVHEWTTLEADLLAWRDRNDQ
ncbi:GNAT family N-acetyltransferase [Pseudodesulfovibrio sp.]|nr:GNAT family N-acetyltransferase [Pseudodesulfovibrio sp.]